MEESLAKIYKESLVYRDNTPHNSRRKLKEYNEKLTWYMNWLEQVENEMEKSGYTTDQITSILRKVRKQHEKEKLLAKSA